MINYRFFSDHVRTYLFNGKLVQPQVNGLNAILNEWEKNYSKKDDRRLAYMLATTHHETDRTMQPIEEYGKGKGKLYGKPDPVTGKAYYGRGFVQLTWKSNYEKMGKVLGADLVNKPELALNMAYATRILFYGMMNGSFTKKKPGDYFNPQKEDWVNARRIINGLGKAHLIADYAKRYYAAISYTV
jgi:hypothetical protein